MTDPVPLALVGVGKIARDQHMPAIAANPDFELTCLVSRSMTKADVPVFASLDAALRDGPPVQAVSLCTPPQHRLELAQTAMRAGCAVMVEKPPTPTLGAAQQLVAHAQEYATPLFFAWHSRFAPMVSAAAAWVSSRNIVSGQIIWREDVEKWHPGQDWLWRPGGFGVFDPGINALSILTQLMSGGYQVSSAVFEVPEAAQTPIAARLKLERRAAQIDVDLDFRETGDETWSIRLLTDAGETLELSRGGAALRIDGDAIESAPVDEYGGVYRHFAKLARAQTSDADVSPLQIVADAFLIAEQRSASRG